MVLLYPKLCLFAGRKLGRYDNTAEIGLMSNQDEQLVSNLLMDVMRHYPNS